MIYSASSIAIAVFLFFVAVVLGISFYLGRRAQSAKGYFAGVIEGMRRLLNPSRKFR